MMLMNRGGVERVGARACKDGDEEVLKQTRADGQACETPLVEVSAVRAPRLACLTICTTGLTVILIRARLPCAAPKNLRRPRPPSRAP